MNNPLLNRFFVHWKTSAAGLLAVAGIVFTALHTNNPNAMWIGTASAIVTGLTGLLAKDS